MTKFDFFFYLVADVDCGMSEVANNRTSFKIIGGLDAVEGEFPW